MNQSSSNLTGKDANSIRSERSEFGVVQISFVKRLVSKLKGLDVGP